MRFITSIKNERAEGVLCQLLLKQDTARNLEIETLGNVAFLLIQGLLLRLSQVVL